MNNPRRYAVVMNIHDVIITRTLEKGAEVETKWSPFEHIF